MLFGKKKKFVQLEQSTTVANSGARDECGTIPAGEYEITLGSYPGTSTQFYFLADKPGWGWFAGNWNLLARQEGSGVRIIEK